MRKTIKHRLSSAQTATAQAEIEWLLNYHKIKVKRYRPSSSGCAYLKTAKIEIQEACATCPDRFGVALHEIKHIIDGDKGKRYEQEFWCDKYALDALVRLGFPGQEEWIRRMRWHSLSRLAMAVNRGLPVAKINPDVVAFFPEIDFKTWEGKSVFVSSAISDLGYSVTTCKKLSRSEIETLLSLRGQILLKSEADDSTYGEWIVRRPNTHSGPTFSSLPEIVSYFNL